MVVREELHRYAKVAETGERVLCLVPEADLDAAPALVERLSKRVEAVHGLVLAAGVAVFPGDALAAEDLVAFADDAREQSAGARTSAGGAAIASDPSD